MTEHRVDQRKDFFCRAHCMLSLFVFRWPGF
jgi:hypothetical protein